MTREEFEADVAREGYALRDGAIDPHTHRPVHTHPFDARLFVLDGAITLVFGEDRQAYGPGDTCHVPAGTPHEEHTGAEGVRYLAGRRTPGQQAAA
jgi:quercetin dioxygenase-like cupin family protein